MVTRVTNIMLQNTLLSNLSMNLNRVDKLQNQLSSGRKYGHISDDPSALIYSQSARNKIERLSHFQGTVETSQAWLTQAEAGVMELNKVVGAIYEELVSAGSVKTDSDKQNLAMVVKQLQDHYLDTLNTSFGDRFVFGAYNTPGDWAAGQAPEVKPFTIVEVSSDDVVPPIIPALIPAQMVPRLHFNGFDISQFDGLTVEQFNIGINNAQNPDQPDILIPGNAPAQDQFDILNKLMNDIVAFDVGPGISMPVTQNGIDIIFFVDRDNDGNAVMRNTYDLLDEVYLAINGVPSKRVTDAGGVYDPEDENVKPKTTDELTILIGKVQGAQNHLLTKTAEIGGRQRRLELLEARYGQDNLNYEKMRSDAEDADMAEVIMFLKMAETVYQAALSAGARVIQPTLMDFLR